MTDQELKDIVAAVVAELEKSGVDFDYKAKPAEDGDLVFVIRGTAPNYQGVTVTWKGLLDIITAQATQAKNDAETAKNAANTILEQVQSKGTEITNFVATSKAELETQKNESVNAVKSVYQTDLNELKGDIVDVSNDINWLANEEETGVYLEFENGSISGSTGQDNADKGKSQFCRTQFVDVDVLDGSYLTLSGKTLFLYEFDSSETFIRYITKSSDYRCSKKDFRDNCKYVRLGYYNATPVGFSARKESKIIADFKKFETTLSEKAFTKPVDLLTSANDLNDYSEHQQLLRCGTGVKNSPNTSYNHLVVVYTADWQGASRYTTIQIAYELSTRMSVSVRYKESSTTTWNAWKTTDLDNIINGNLLQNAIIDRAKLKDFYQSSVSDMVGSGTDINTFNKANAFFSNTGALNNPNNKDPFFIYSFVMPWQGASRYTLVEMAFNKNDLSDVYIRDYDSGGDSWGAWKNIFVNNYGKGKTVVMMGDSTYDITGSTNKRINDFVEKYLRCTVINCGMGGTRMSDSRGASSADSYKPFDFPNLIDAKQANNYSAQEQKLSDKATSFVEAFNLFKGLDFAKVDVLCIEYGANDFYSTNNVGVPIGDYTKDRTTYTGAMIYCVEKLLSAYPNLTIFVDGIRYRYFLDDNDDAFTHKNNLGLKSKDYVEAEIKVAKMYGLPYADNLDGYGWNKYNRSIYFQSTDGTHFNDKGTKFAGKILAEHLRVLGCMTE